MSTIFSKIIAGEIPCDKVYESDTVLAFKDIAPNAKIHVLFIHKEETKNLSDLMKRHPEQISEIFQAITEYVEQVGLEQSGYRVVTNINQFGGQTVFHTHFHLLAGEQLRGFGA